FRDENGGRKKKQKPSRVSAREVLRARRRVAVCAASERARRDQLFAGQLRSVGRERADDATARRRGNRARHFGADISWAHGTYAGCDHSGSSKSRPWRKRRDRGG